MGENEDLEQWKGKLSKGLVTWRGWLAPEGSVACVEGHIGLIMLVPLT